MSKTSYNFEQMSLEDELSKPCYLKDIQLPSNGLKWQCDKDINNETVPKQARCSVICEDGYDAESVGRRDFHKCIKSGEWRFPERVNLKCSRNRKSPFDFFSLQFRLRVLPTVVYPPR